MNFLVLDVETTTFNEGHPFDNRNKLCIISWATASDSGWVKIEYDDDPYSHELSFIQRLIDECDVLLGFNFKFDLHWLRRYGLTWKGKRVWCCQLVEFMLDRQRSPYPSLEGTGQRLGLGGKSSSEVSEYWSSGFDTTEIPLPVLSAYGVRDAELTRDVYKAELRLVAERGTAFTNLVALHNEDLLVLQEMEWNGLLFDISGARIESERVGKEIEDILPQLHEFFKVGEWVNFGSSKQLSALLFGGKITEEWKEQIGVYKTGQKIGQPRYKWFEREHEFPQLVKPLKGRELDGGGWSTAEDHLRSIKPGRHARAAIDLLLKRSELEKLRDTYLEGLPKLMSTMGWTDGYIHGQINQSVARTGRSSSSKPNLQNMPPKVDTFFQSRFGDRGRVIGFDAKGLEWVGIAFLSQDPVAMQEIWKGVDQHEMNKERFGLPEKRVAKFFVFRLIYGGTAYAFTVDPDFFWVSDDVNFWEDVRGKFYDKYKGIETIHTAWFRNAVENGLYTAPTGRQYVFTNDGGDWKYIRPVILNYPVQGLGHDLMAIARVSLYKRLAAANLKSKLVNTIHDSIVLDILMEEWYTIQQTVKEVFDDIPKNFEKLFGKPFNLPMRAEAKSLNGEEITV